jgi:hypothetical protein
MVFSIACCSEIALASTQNAKFKATVADSAAKILLPLNKTDALITCD